MIFLTALWGNLPLRVCNLQVAGCRSEFEKELNILHGLHGWLGHLPWNKTLQWCFGDVICLDRVSQNQKYPISVLKIDSLAPDLFRQERRLFKILLFGGSYRRFHSPFWLEVSIQWQAISSTLQYSSEYLKCNQNLWSRFCFALLLHKK